MSSVHVNAVIERIRTDPEFAQAVVEQGAAALEPFDLSDADRTAIVEALHRDIAEQTDEVQGFGIHVFHLNPLTHLTAIGIGPPPAEMDGVNFHLEDPLDEG